ncbi:MAG: FAD-dependent thymidylate synthase, partial [Planctomycetes bacterium]|nr:FAD-dependent thymidylate synthase [Planctomycetota bacterium]
MKIDVLDKGYVKLVDSWGGDALIVDTARLSRQSESSGQDADERLIRHLWAKRHTTPFEFAGMIIEVKAPLIVARQ